MTDATHECAFPEVVIEDANDDGDPLRPGMRILIPCSCGDTPLDAMELLHTHLAETQAAILALEPFRFLFHWAPTARRKQIIRYGLRPGMRSTTSSERMGAPCICLADSPSWAWALSGGMSWTPSGSWDLWQTSLDRLTDPVVLATNERPSGMYEVRTEHRIFKRDLWLVGSRIVD